MEDHNATEPEHQPEDARALVAALTTLLVDDPSPALGAENRTNLIDRGTLAMAWHLVSASLQRSDAWMRSSYKDDAK